MSSTPSSAAAGPVDPVVYDASVMALRQRTANFTAKRYADMMFVSGLDRATADRHFRPRAAAAPTGLDARPTGADIGDEVRAAFAAGRVVVETNAVDRRVAVRWAENGFSLTGQAVARPDYGGILLGPQAEPAFDPRPLGRTFPPAELAWPIGDAVEVGATPLALTAAMDAFFAGSAGVYGVLVAAPDRVLAERYSDFGGPDRATPSWSMTKAVTCTQIGRLIRMGWLGSVHDPAPAPLWHDQRAIHGLITLDHLLRMRAGLGFPVRHADGGTAWGFENSAVYHDAGDAFTAAQRCAVATIPGAAHRYINSGLNVLGAIIRDQIERRGLPYHQTVYGLVADRLGMRSYQQSADMTGNLIASGAGFATLRDYARLGVLYLDDGVWDGERLLPEGWADDVLTVKHDDSNYAACFATNSDGLFPDLPRDTAWASGASEQRIFILRRHRLTVVVANETDYPMDLAALNRLVATAIDCYA
jgi:CubicO group peptidase (beta-lactamase class C family)